MAWAVEFHHGIHLTQVGWWLDARFPVDRSFVSHAHSDHVAAHREVLCSPATARLLRARVPGRRVEHRLPFGHTEALTADAAVTLYPAGHILGSAQCLVERAPDGRLLYTGDFKLRPGRSAEPCATPRADVLIMETTFGLPRYVFPPDAEVWAGIVAFCRQALADRVTPVLLAYSLGKTQELLCGLAEHQLPVMLPPQGLRLTRVYAAAGRAMPACREFDAADLPGHVVISPPAWGGDPFLEGIKKRRTAVVTGWALDRSAIYRYQCDAAFPLSDHADFNDLLALVERVQPRLVYTVHGYAQEFARTLRARGIEAWAPGAVNQLELGV
jgi:Cft2 family RNA processing exonuclease